MTLVCTLSSSLHTALGRAGKVRDGRQRLKTLGLRNQRQTQARAQDVCLESALGVWPGLRVKTLTNSNICARFLA